MNSACDGVSLQVTALLVLIILSRDLSILAILVNLVKLFTCSIIIKLSHTNCKVDVRTIEIRYRWQHYHF